MRYTQAEKLEIIRLVDESDLPVKRTLTQLGVSKSTFYEWYRRYLDDGPAGLAPRPSQGIGISTVYFALRSAA